jgi:elongation factor Ts
MGELDTFVSPPSFHVKMCPRTLLEGVERVEGVQGSMEFTVKDIQRLREETGAGPLDCKKALTDAASFEEAVKTLAKKTQQRADKLKAEERETRQGYIAAYTHFNGNLGVLVEVNCSTDFVSRNDEFRTLANELALQVAALDPKYISFDEIPAEAVEKVRQEVLDDPEVQKRPANIQAQIVEGRVRKEFEPLALLTQPWFKDEKVKIGDMINELIRKTGENIVVRRFVRFKLGE